MWINSRLLLLLLLLAQGEPQAINIGAQEIIAIMVIGQ